MLKRSLILTTFVIFIIASAASAFTITSQLTGDPRPGNPDNLIVDVTIDVDELISPTVASWTVDINSPSHPNIKLDAFFFNLDLGLGETVAFGNFDPTGWTVTSPANNAQGSGGANFMFAADKSVNSADNVTNAQSLTFDMTANFSLLESTFLDAINAISNDAALGQGQLGAHLQSLVAGQGESDSGFAFGNYEGDGGLDPGGDPIPEPSTMLLLGAGLVGLGLYSRKRK